MFPVHRRWLSSLPAEGRTWTPSLYGGLIPLIAAACAWRWRRATDRERWALLMVLLGIFGSLGWYGLGWVVQEIRAAVATKAPEPRIGQPTGGLYWLFTVLLPGYVYFRYPAKWFVVAALGLSLLGARGIDRLETDSHTARRVARWLSAGSLLLIVVSLLFRSSFLRWANGAEASDLFGPLDGPASWRDIFSAFGQTMLVAIGFLMVMRAGVLPRLQRVARPSIFCLVITALDITLANSWLLATTRSSVLDSNPTSITAIYGPPLQNNRQTRSLRLVHDDRLDWTPNSWRQVSDIDRVSDICAWERQALLHKYHLIQRLAVFDTRSTLFPAEFQAMVNILEDRQKISAMDRDRLLSDLDVEYAIGQVNSNNVTVSHLESSTAQSTRVRIARDVRQKLVQRNGVTLDKLKTQLRQMWFSTDGNRHDPRTVFVESLPSGQESQFMRIEAKESCVITRYESQRIEIDVDLQAPALLVVSDLYDRGWKANTQTQNRNDVQRRNIVCVNGLIRGIWLEGGRHKVTMYYRPTSLVVGAILTGITIVAAISVWLRKSVLLT
jgi:hypothetical protein